MPRSVPWPGLLGRHVEYEALTRLAGELASGHSQVLVLRGEAGIGKSVLLDVLARRASGCRCARTAAVAAEAELEFAALHQLCVPYLGLLASLPEWEQTTLRAAFRLRAGPPPDPPAVAAGVLALLARIADDRPLLCLVDDAQWLDPASAAALESVADRLTDKPVALVFAVREPPGAPVLTRLPELVLRGLDPPDAAALLDAVVPFTLDPRVRRRILAETRGNPRALLQLPRMFSPAQLAFGGAADGEHPVKAQAMPRLPAQSTRLLLLAAAEPVGDLSLLLRAARRLGIPTQAVTTAERSGLIALDEVVRFRHPLVRPAVYAAATPAERRAVHAALAEVTDADGEPGRRAWHRARAAVSPDDTLAEELERCTDRALAHGGLATAAAFLEHAAALAPDVARRPRRALDAAESRLLAGELDEASALLAAARADPVQPRERARADLLAARIVLAAEGGRRALPRLLVAARGLEPLDPRLARDGYLDAMSAALLAGRLAPAPGSRGVSEAVRKARCPASRAGDAVLDALSALFRDGHAATAPLVHDALHGLRADDPDVQEALRVAWPAAIAAASTWDDESWDVLTRRHLAVARRTGAVRALPLALHTRASFQLLRGNLDRATSLVAQGRTLAPGSDVRVLGYTELGVSALRGSATADPLIERCLAEAGARGEGYGVATCLWAKAVLDNGLGRYRSALEAAREASEPSLELGPAVWALAEVVEAAVHVGDTAAAIAGLERLSGTALASGTAWALGVEASRRALVEDGSTADALHRQAVTLLSGTKVRVELARAQLLYGEWLRREGRRVDARTQLHAARQSFGQMGLRGFADRAGRELLATGETARGRTTNTARHLTAQEEQVVRLAVDGSTNSEIAAALFISPRTVEWHLRRIFAKVGVQSRRELGKLAPPG